MSRQIQSLTYAFSQQTLPEFWNWSDAEKQTTVDIGDTKATLKLIYDRIHEGLKQSGATGDDLKFEFAGILHDKDHKLKMSSDGEIEQVEVVPHIHGMISFTKKRDLNAVASWIGIVPTQVEQAKKGRYGKENILAYLIHAKAPSKYQYPPSDVETFGTFDYMQYFEDHAVDWMKQAAKVRKQDSVMSADMMVQKVRKGLMTKEEILDNEEYFEIYGENKRRFDEAFELYQEMLSHRGMKALKNKEYELSVLFFTGAPGSGKTVFAKKVAEQMEKKFGWRTYEASAEHSMDGYSNEEILFMDDVRAYSMSQTTWLQMMNIGTKAQVAARYKNKEKIYRVLIITSYQEPLQFFHDAGMKSGNNEALDQFIRRLMLCVKVFRTDDGSREYQLEMIGRLEPAEIFTVETPKGPTSIEMGYKHNEIYRGSEEVTASYIENIVAEKNTVGSPLRDLEPPIINQHANEHWEMINGLCPKETGSDDESDQLTLPLI